MILKVMFIRKTMVKVIMLSLAAVLTMASRLPAADPSNEQWKYLGGNDKGTQFYYDAASVLYLSKDLINVWTRELAPNTAPTRKLMEINCAFRIMRDREVIVEKTDTKAPRIRNKPSAWHAMEKDPVTNTMYKTLCR